MTVRKALLVAALLLLAGVPAATASFPAAPAPAPAASAASSADCAAAAPPCGYIVPQLSLEFPDKPTCRAETLGGPIALDECLPLPAPGGKHTETGLLRFSWDITQDGTYPADPMQPIVISFSGTATNPKWMSLSVDPQEITLDAAALANPVNMRPDPETQQLWFWYEVPLTLTFERTGNPDGAGLAKVDRAQGVAQVFLKAKSSASGAYYKEAFGVEEFRFNACAPEAAIADQVAACGGAPANDAPAPGLLLAFAALALAGLVRRRA